MFDCSGIIRYAKKQWATLPIHYNDLFYDVKRFFKFKVMVDALKGLLV